MSRRLAWTVSVAVGILLAAIIGPAHAGPAVEVQRQSGRDRYETAAAAARASSESAFRVVLASGEDFPDALSASAAASYHGGPLLLTPKARLHSATAAALQELDPYEVVLIGGTAAIASSVQAEVRELGFNTYRTAGRDRYETAVNTAYSMSDSGCHCPPADAVLASGEVYPDGVSAAPLFSSRDTAGRSLLLTGRQHLPAVTRAHLQDHVQRVLIVGGTGVVSAAVEQEIRGICRPDGSLVGGAETCISVERIAGQNRQETAVAVSEYMALNGWDGTRAVLSYGESFPDALVAGSYARSHAAVSLLTLTPTNLGDPARRFLERHRAAIMRLDIIGDQSVVSDAVVADARDAATT